VRKSGVSPYDTKRQVEAAKVALQYRPYPEDCRVIRQHNKKPFRALPRQQDPNLKLGERYCLNCIHHAEEPVQGAEIQRLHVWVAFRWNFKLELAFYETVNKHLWQNVPSDLSRRDFR